VRSSDDAADIVFSMSAAGSSGSGGGDGPRKKPPTVAVRVTTGGGHKAITPDMIESEDTVTPPQRPSRRRRSPTSEQEAAKLRAAWDELEATRRKMEDEWPDDLTQPHIIPTIQAIDWQAQPPIPAEKIDWSKQGEPLRVRPTWGAMVVAISMIVSILGAGAYFYWGIKMHVTDQRIHLPGDGVPWGVKAVYETRKEARQARENLAADIVKTVKAEVSTVRQDVVRELRKSRRRRR